MQPTDQALLLADAADQAWALIAEAVENLRAAGGETELHVLAPSTFAMRWLIPRLWSFTAGSEGIAVQLRQTHSLEDWRDIPFDVAIRTDSKLPHHLVAVPILHERLGLALSPGAVNARQVQLPFDLSICKLLRAAHASGRA
jgi:DNA-binding transcriptional LysR family regulator